MPSSLSLFYISLAGYFGSAVIQFTPVPKMGRALLIPAWLIHTFFIAQYWLTKSQLPLSGLFGPLNFFAWCILTIYTLMILGRRQRQPGKAALLIATFLMLCGLAAPKEVRPLPEALDTIWFELHVASAFIAYAIFALAGSACLKSGDPKLGFRLTSWGLLVFSASMLTGGIWAYLAWADYWVWTSKELWSVLIWIYYSTVLHAARLPGWKRRASIMVVLGFLLLMFTYLGVGLLMKSSHPL